MGSYICDSSQETIDEKHVFYILSNKEPVIKNKGVQKIITIPCTSSEKLSTIITIKYKNYPLIKNINQYSTNSGFKVCLDDIIEIKTGDNKIIPYEGDLFLAVEYFIIGKKKDGLDYEKIRNNLLNDFIPYLQIYHSLLHF